MRVLYTAFDVVPGPKGASLHITQFVRSLVAGGYQVQLITAGDGELPGHATYEGASIIRVPPERPGLTFLERAVAFGHAVMDHVAAAPAYDLVHYRSIWSGLQLAQARVGSGYRTLFEVNGLPSIELPYHYPDLRQHPLLHKIREQELATLALSQAVICPSDVTRAFLVSLGVPRERITIIRNGITPSEFAPSPVPIPDSEPPVILYVGTLAEWQGLDVMIRALPLIIAHHPARLRIVGRGRSRQRKLLERQIRKLGLEQYVQLEPAVAHHQVPAMIAQATLCVAPLSLNDRNVVQGCCPIKVLEYMAAGRPLVAANLPVVRELVQEDRDGLLFRPDDPTDLARQITTLLRDPQLAQRLARSAAERAHHQFTWHAAGKRLLKQYEALLMRKERPTV
ncbi:MAG: glycosyltransferase family 4 protein [Chloroflexaceae bacterium]|nr:glycosyltransferase family 4 protein [Chloroflexaceae bacterium]